MTKNLKSLREASQSYVSDVSNNGRVDELIGTLATLGALGYGGYKGAQLLGRGYAGAKKRLKAAKDSELAQDAWKGTKATAKGLYKGSKAVAKGLYKGAGMADELISPLLRKGAEKGISFATQQAKKGASAVGNLLKDKFSKKPVEPVKPPVEAMKPPVKRKRPPRKKPLVKPMKQPQQDDDEYSGTPV